MGDIDDLLDSIFAGLPSGFVSEFERWVRGSRRFKAFALSHRSKIRTKLKNVRDEGGLQDLQAELEAAFLLLHEERFALDYEAYVAAKQRGPDFTVTYKANVRFNVEVRRIRGLEWDDRASDARLSKLMAVLCDKVGQMPAGIVNLLWLKAEQDVSTADLAQAERYLRQLAESKAEDYFTRRGFASAAAFLRQSGQLSAIALHQMDGMTFWLNPHARHKTPPDLLTALRRLGAG